MNDTSILHLKTKYIVVLIFFAILACISSIIIESVVASQERSASEINIAGRQRMLSQKIILLSDRFNQKTNTVLRSEIYTELINTMSLMETSHQALTNGNVKMKLVAPQSDELKEMYFGSEMNVDGEIEAFLKLAGRIIPKTANDYDWNRPWQMNGDFDVNRLLLHLDQIVNQYQIENEAKIEKLRTYQILTLVVTLISLGGAGIFVFQPMVFNIKRYTNDLTEANDRFRSISRSSANAMIVAVDKLGYIIAWNPAAERAFGYSEEETVGMSLQEIMPEKYRDAHNKGFKHAAESENYSIIGKTVEVIGLKKNGDEFPIELSLGTWQHGRNKYFSAVIHDITDRKLAENQLIDAKMDAERANHSKSEFLSSMSHELRTPLNAVLGFAQMLQYDPRTSLTESQNEYVESILNGGNHLLDLVNQILDLGRIEAGLYALSIEDVIVGDVVSDCVDLMKSTGEEANINVINDIKNVSASVIFTDKLHFKQVLISIISNAIKFNNPGGKVTISGHETENQFYRITVEDTGVGIKEENYDGVFHVFDRLGKDSTHASEGAGTSLTVAKLIVERLAGNIDFISHEGVGSKFWVDIPLLKNDRVLIWTEAKRVGIDAIDKDHQAIISLSNKVLSRSLNEEELVQCVGDLIAFSKEHFVREEAIMSEDKNPELAAHKQLHDVFTVKITSLFNELQSDYNDDLIGEIEAYLITWFKDHMYNVDTKIKTIL